MVNIADIFHATLDIKSISGEFFEGCFVDFIVEAETFDTCQHEVRKPTVKYTKFELGSNEVHDKFEYFNR